MELLASFGRKAYSKLYVLSYDILSIPVAWCLAYWLRFNLGPVSREMITDEWFYALGILTVVQVTSYYYFRVYRGLWRFSSINDVFRIIKAVVSSIFLIVPIFYLISLLGEVPRSVLPLYGIILITLLCGARLVFRSWRDKHQPFMKNSSVKRVLIIGAGQAGEGLVRDLKRSQAYMPVGLIDDDIAKRGLEVHGVGVLGTTEKLCELVAQYSINLIFIAIPSIGSSAMRRLVQACAACNVPFRTLPSLQALASGHVEVNALREVNIEDLLGRDQVDLNWDRIADSLKDKRVLVTGGGGSIGAELCRQIAARKPQKLMILDNSEFNLYQIDMELRNNFPQISLELALISVEDRPGVAHLLKQFKPDIVFHAAAYKHVPMLENQARLAVQNNVLGTQIVAEASVAAGAKKFILISTDKAVNPTNIMGLTKRVAEIFCQNLNLHSKTQFITVRFGNVLGSKGSVIPLFQKQLKEGGPITVTHPDIERYFMTISEACQLILQAMTNGQGGEIFVLDMGEPIKINYLAEQMIRLAGKEPRKDIQIEYTGLRPGEKLYEELFHETEHLEQTEHEKLFKAQFRKIDWMELKRTMISMHQACASLQEEDLLLMLKNLVPEYRRQDVLAIA